MPLRRRIPILLSVGLFAALGLLAAAVNTDWAVGLDTGVAEWFDGQRTPRREVEADGVFGYLGRPIHVLVPAMVFGALLSWRARSVMPGLCVVGGVGAGAVLEATLKAVVGRTATTDPLVYYQHSYPSGHVTGAAALLGMIAVCLGVGAGRGVRAVLAGAAGAGVLSVAVLALYTGAHTCTDVIGGLLLGGAIVAAGAAVLTQVVRT